MSAFFFPDQTLKTLLVGNLNSIYLESRGIRPAEMHLSHTISVIIGSELDDVLEAFFLQPLIIDAFEPPDHKSHFDFTLAYPWNVQIQFKYSASDYKFEEYG